MSIVVVVILQKNNIVMVSVSKITMAINGDGYGVPYLSMNPTLKQMVSLVGETESKGCIFAIKVFVYC